jgi:predicted nucleic acid-binding protein
MLLIADASVLINFLRVDRMYLVGKHYPRCAITEHVLDEISDLQQQKVLQKALADGHLDVISVTEETEVELFAKLQQNKRLGPGECSAIAVALRRGYVLGMDDRVATEQAHTFAAAENLALTVYGTQEIIVRLIRAGNLTVEQADFLLVAWRTQHRFKLKIQSFAELL